MSGPENRDETLERVIAEAHLLGQRGQERIDQYRAIAQTPGQDFNPARALNRYRASDQYLADRARALDRYRIIDQYLAIAKTADQDFDRAMRASYVALKLLAGD